MSDELPPSSHVLGSPVRNLGRPPSLPDSVLERSLALVRRNLFQECSPLLAMGRFELRRTLGHGGMGVAYEAYDPLRRELVALKTLHALGPSGLFLLKREFRSLARLSHRNLVVLHDLSVEADDAFFSMELVDGVDFVSYVRKGVPVGGRPGEARLCDAFVQLCEGVHALHENGKLHRDLKPSNVLVTAEGRVVLLDFGLVHELDDGHHVAVGGTPAYMAPEQRTGEVGTHSDFFAVGRILDEALHGRCAPSSRRTERHPHRPWDALCSRLLSPEPGARPGFDEIVATVRAPRALARKARRRGAGDPFVGRARELAALGAAFSASADGPVVVSLRGEAGIGKSTLVRRFLDGLSRDRQVLVLRGACHERESVPFKALDSVIDDLTQHLVDDDSVTLTGDERAALRLLFPVFGRLPSFAGTTVPRAGDLMAQRARAFTAFGSLLGQLARARRLVVCIDDAQWSDTDSGQLLSALLSDANPPPLLLVMIDRCERASDNPALTALRDGTDDDEQPLALVELPLGPLGDQEAVALAMHFADLAGGDDARVARLAGESRGNPLLLSALAGWAATEPVWSSDAISLDAALGHRLSSVSELSKSVLSLVVLAGFPIASTVLADALALDGVPYAALDQLRAARLIHTRKARELLVVAPDHGTVAEAVLRRIDTVERAALHLRLAQALERVEGVPPELLVEQYVGAERFETAATYARRAADAALFGLAFASAAALYQRAIALGSWSAEDQVALHASLARALEHSGSWQAAVDVWLRAARLTDDRMQALKFEGCAAEHLSYHGRFDEAAPLLRRGYATLGLHWPKTRLGLRLRLGTELLAWLLRWGLRIRPKRLAMSREEGRARFEYLSSIGRTLDFQDIERSLYNVLICFAESDRLDEPHLNVRVRGARAMLPVQLPLEFLLARGVRELTAACDEAARLGDAEGHLYLQAQRAIVVYLAGQTRPALEAAQRVEALLRSLPRRPIDLEAVMAINAFALLDLGELRELSRYLGAFEREAKLTMQETGVWFVMHPARFSLMLAADDVDGMRAELAEIERSGLTRATMLTARWAYAQAQVELAIYAGDAAVAQAMLARQLRLLRAPGVRAMDDYVRLARARIALMAAATEVSPRARARLIRRAEKDAAVLARRRGRMSTGPAQLLRATIAVQKGQVARALKELALARAGAEAAEHKLFVAVVRVCEGTLRGDDEGSAIANTAFRVIEAEGVRNPHRWVASVACGFQGLLGHAEHQRGEHERPGASRALAQG